MVTIPISLVTNLGDSLKKLKENGFWMIGTAVGTEAKPPWEMPDFEKVVVVLGAELEGMGAKLRKLCDWQIEIPLTGKIRNG